MKSKEEFYKWFKSTNSAYYDIQCLANSQQYLAYSSMKKAEFLSYIQSIISTKSSKLKMKRNKLIQNLINPRKPFYFPYLPIHFGVERGLISLNETIKTENEKIYALKRTKSNTLNLKYCTLCKRNDVKLRLCGDCLSVYYCSKHCQKISWLDHRHICCNLI